MASTRPRAGVTALPTARTTAAPAEPAPSPSPVGAGGDRPDRPDRLVVGKEELTAPELVQRYLDTQEELRSLRKRARDALRTQRAELQLRPWQVELLKLQRHLEDEACG